jgi:predicted transcriptional regulator YheO
MLNAEREAEHIMTDEECLNFFKPLVPFIAQCCGPACEVVLHDCRKPEKSTIAIENGYHSNRKLGDPLTDFGQAMINSKIFETNDFLSNYNGNSKGHDFLCGTYFIKNEGRLIGMLCINRDMTMPREALKTMQHLYQQYNLLSKSDLEYQERLDVPVDRMLNQMIIKAVSDIGKPVFKMSRQDKVAVVHALNEQGVLKMKGAINETAHQLQISVPTLYRYIKHD